MCIGHAALQLQDYLKLCLRSFYKLWSKGTTKLKNFRSSNFQKQKIDHLTLNPDYYCSWAFILNLILKFMIENKNFNLQAHFGILMFNFSWFLNLGFQQILKIRAARFMTFYIKCIMLHMNIYYVLGHSENKNVKVFISMFLFNGICRFFFKYACLFNFIVP